MLQTPGRRARRPCGQDLRPGPGSARTVCLPWRRADQGPAVFRGILFFFFPLVLQRFFVLRGAVSCWNSFHNKLKNPAVALEAAVEAEGSCVLSRMGGAVQLLRWVPCQTQCQPGWGWGVASAHGWLGLGHRRKPRAGWIVRYRGPEAERGRTTELTFPRCH